jgi:hypothetical protein
VFSPQEAVVHLGLIKAFVLIVTAGSFATAADFSFAGSLATDNSSRLFTFSLVSTSTITLQTYSYAGGVNQAGTVVPRGGFDPILDLFDSAGVLINRNDDGYANVPADSVTGQHWDSYLRTTLATGTYTICLTQYDNFPNGPNLSDGFSRLGQSNFTNTFGCSNGGFCDRTASNRTANWEFDVLGATSAATVPEPALPALLALGMAFIGALHSRKFRSNFFVLFRSHEGRKF